MVCVIVAWVIVKHPDLKVIKRIEEKISEYREELDLALSEGEEGARMVRALRRYFSWEDAADFIETIPREVYKRHISKETLAEIELSEDTGQQLRALAQDILARALKNAQ